MSKSKLNVQEICQPLLDHFKTVLSAGLDLSFDQCPVYYSHDGFSISKDKKSFKSGGKTLINAHILPSKNGNFLRVAMSGTVGQHQELYQSIFNESIVDIDYLHSVIQRFFDVGYQWKQFDTVEYHPKDLSIPSLTNEDPYLKRTTKKHLAMFYYSARSLEAKKNRHYNYRKQKTKHSICTMSLDMANYSGKLVPVYTLNVPILADLKFTFVIDANKGISEDDIQLLLFKYENCIRLQLYEIIRMNLRLKQHQSLGEITNYSMQELVDYVLVTEMSAY